MPPTHPLPVPSSDQPHMISYQHIHTHTASIRVRLIVVSGQAARSGGHLQFLLYESNTLFARVPSEFFLLRLVSGRYEVISGTLPTSNQQIVD